MALRGAIFDMDGTLLDSMEGWMTAGETYLRSRGIVPHGGEQDSLMYQSMMGIAAHFRHTYGLPEAEEEIVRGINDQVRAFYETRATAVDGVAAVLARFKAAGIPLCVATATDRCLAQPALERAGLSMFFDRIFTCTEVGAGKTRSRIFDEARAFMGTPREDTWVFEDALYAARTAKAAGYAVCGVYDRFEPCPDELKALCDMYIRSYRELDADRLLKSGKEA